MKLFFKFFIFILMVFFLNACVSTKPYMKNNRTYVKNKTLDTEFAYIAPGTFIMGSSNDEKKEKIDNNESPAHPVKISKGFYLQTTETTQGQWEKIMGNNPSANKKCGKDCPVTSVSWHNIQLFIKKLNKIEKTKTYRLPTEAEWEYAARAGTSTVFSFGNCLSIKDANYNGGVYFGCSSDGNAKRAIVPVGSYKPNQWGIYDMHGNIFEICQDWLKKKYPNKLDIDPKGRNKKNGISLRGGSYRFNANRARSANRTSIMPNAKGSNIGFRLAKSE